MSSITSADQDSETLSAYAYSYPHKSSYRPLAPAVSLEAAWANEDMTRLSLYAHIPFCEMRCGFCNLFTQSQAGADIIERYLATLVRQMQVVRSQLPQAQFAQFAIGGGTPTYLNAAQLQSLLSHIERTFERSVRSLPTSIETSPATATTDRLQVLSDFGIERVSLGVQSFVDVESHRIGRPQRIEEVHRALRAIRDYKFPVLNIDLIYGDPQQSLDTWLTSLHEALAYLPEEFYLYPLYIRPETGLARTGHRAAQHRTELYRAARDLLVESGYQQTSLRCFRKPQTSSPSTYACQRDGMIGLGCGARSYTNNLHYATRFAVTQAGVRAIIQDWIQQSDAELGMATHGIRLSVDEQLRRFVIMSLLQVDGLLFSEYQSRFEAPLYEALPELAETRERGWLEELQDRWRLTADGIEHSDEVGPLLYSDTVRASLKEFVRL